MREIEFRGRDIAGNWHYGFPMVFSEDFATITKPFEHNKTIEIKTLGQYTGLKDRNGTKIFEGDIVKCYLENVTNKSEIIGTIEYFELAFGVVSIDKKKMLHFNTMSVYVKGFEVIGNIYDNPELLEVSDD